ncbi:MAG TPA: alpha/beta fold hydrolase [Burkholderiaceae bacterium]|nr:alpha/beta fold hydrolase [Burkholderiaceae bacterium]
MTLETVQSNAAPFFLKGGDIGVVVCHGFTGSPQSMRYLGERLHAAGLTVIGPRLKGHGEAPAALATATAADWIASVDDAIQTLRAHCSQIFMLGQSMGGTLTLYTAAMHRDLLRGVITINAAVRLSRPDMAAMAFDRSLPETVPGVGSDIKDRTVSEVAYPVVPVVAFRQLYALIGVTHDLLPRVQCPTLVITARDDHVVDPANGPLIAGKVGARRVEMAWLDNSYHIASMDHDKDLIVQLADRFIRSVAER